MYTARKQLTQENVEETRSTILRVAQQFFMRYGYRAVTTRQLADACGLTQPALYHHFADKQALYLAVVTEELTNMKVAIERIVRRSDEVPERLKSLASFLLSRIQYDLGLMLHDVRYELSPDARASLNVQFREGVIAPIAEVFAEGMRQQYLLTAEQGGLAPSPAAYLFMNIISSFAARTQEDGSAPARQAQQGASAEAIVRILLHGMVSPSRS
ncbi:MAG TPA: TetR/AcrR family transcriptional regulator [Ktedonobacteraceae bacterium]